VEQVVAEPQRRMCRAPAAKLKNKASDADASLAQRFSFASGQHVRGLVRTAGLPKARRAGRVNAAARRLASRSPRVSAHLPMACLQGQGGTTRPSATPRHGLFVLWLPRGLSAFVEQSRGLTRITRSRGAATKSLAFAPQRCGPDHVQCSRESPPPTRPVTHSHPRTGHGGKAEMGRH
jgi:hypothetical protein